jgi:hypothetical protein
VYRQPPWEPMRMFGRKKYQRMREYLYVRLVVGACDAAQT